MNRIIKRNRKSFNNTSVYKLNFDTTIFLMSLLVLISGCTRSIQMDENNPLECTCFKYSADKFLKPMIGVYLTNKGSEPIKIGRQHRFYLNSYDSNYMAEFISYIAYWEDIGYIANRAWDSEVPGMVVNPGNTKIAVLVVLIDRPDNRYLRRSNRLKDGLGSSLKFGSYQCFVDELKITETNHLTTYNQTWKNEEEYLNAYKIENWMNINEEDIFNILQDIPKFQKVK